MSLGKLVTLGILGVLAWQHQALIESKVGVVKSLYPTFQTYRAMRAIRDPLAKHTQENGGRAPRDVSRWIARSFEGSATPDPELDHFGNPYILTRDRNRQPELRSCGPDGRCGTEDDLVVPVGKPLAGV